MAFIQYLQFNSEKLPKPISYSPTLTTIEAESSGVTEAGTYQRDVVRTGVTEISVEFHVTSKWLKKLTAYSKLNKIDVDFFNPETATLTTSEMYMTGYTVKLERDTSTGGLWSVSFTLKEF